MFRSVGLVPFFVGVMFVCGASCEVLVYYHQESEIAKYAKEDMLRYLHAMEAPLLQIEAAFKTSFVLNEANQKDLIQQILFSQLQARPTIDSLFVTLDSGFETGFVRSLGVIAQGASNHTTTPALSLAGGQSFGGACNISSKEIATDCLSLFRLNTHGRPTTQIGEVASRTRFTPAYNQTLERRSVYVVSDSPLALELTPAQPCITQTIRIKDSFGNVLGIASASSLLSDFATTLALKFNTTEYVVYARDDDTAKAVVSSINVTSLNVLAADYSHPQIQETNSNILELESGYVESQFNLSKAASMFASQQYIVHTAPFVLVSDLSTSDDGLPDMQWVVVVVQPANTQRKQHASSILIGISVTAFICFCSSVFLLVWLINFRNMELWRAASLHSSTLILFSNMLCALCSVLLAAEPSNRRCVARQWFTGTSVILAYTGFFTKILETSVMSERRRISTKSDNTCCCFTLTPRRIGQMVIVVSVLEVLLISFQTVQNPQRETWIYAFESSHLVIEATCQSDTVALNVIRILFFSALLIGGIVALRMLQYSHIFRDIRAMITVFINMGLLITVIAMIRIFSLITGNALQLIGAVLMLWFVISIQLVLFVPRVHRHLTIGDYTIAELREQLVRQEEHRKRQMQRNAPRPQVQSLSSTALVRLRRPDDSPTPSSRGDFLFM
eukprot:c12209_g1_i1.p1 GENE.c12209_g1_i1~~c12209_g1_i1.p1  ORF type:complete len:675 (+),score=146.94 c12209_g1_i1:219-2243(+)